MSSVEEEKKLSRRDFVKGAAAGAAAMASAGVLAGCGSKTQEEPAGPAASQEGGDAKPWLPEKWDHEADVVVVGYGFAGACAAIAAKDAGSDVLILEKTLTAEGGNSGCCSGSMHTYLGVEDPELWISKAHHHCWGTVPDIGVIREYITEALKTKAWLEGHGMQIEETSGAASVRRPGGTGGQMITELPPGEERAAGMYVFKFLHDIATEKGVNMLFGTPATELIQDPGTKEILGVKAKTGVTLTKWSPENTSCYTGGEDIYIKARKAVILSCGGYENNPNMQFNFNYPGLRLYPWGTPYNTGDGIKMSMEVGARQWHLHGQEWASANFKLASEMVDHAMSISATTSITPDNHLFVNRDGQRFMNEVKSMGHDIEHKPATDFSSSRSEYVNMPFFVVFDNSVMKAGPICPHLGRTGTRTTYNSVHRSYVWSDDNSAELEKGWIFKGDTLEELAANIKGTDYFGQEWGVDPAGLVAAVEKYNAAVAAGEDPEFGRPSSRLASVETPPFYAIEMGFSSINTQGGPERNGKCQIVNHNGQPIPRLYGAGELGSYNGFEYVMGNIVEALTTGRVAGLDAAGLSPWS